MTSTPFSDLPLPAAMLDNLHDIGYRQMTEVQRQSLPLLLAGRDLIVRAKTGSGKTAAFGIGVLLQLEPARYSPQSLVLCPTRELATQVAQELRRLARYLPNIKVLTLCGGTPIGPQIGSLEHGAHVVVGTPGRIRDHLRKGTLNLERIRTLVLDEADRMLDMGFRDEIRQIAAETPKERQTLLFSATYPEEIGRLSQDFQRDPAEVILQEAPAPLQIRQCFFETDRESHAGALHRLLLHYRPEAAVIFCNTRQSCNDIGAYLNDQGFSALILHGDLDQRERDQVLVRFANRSCPLLIATDVAARGLDIDDLPCVINFELTRDAATHTHRIGRTGRAGREGLALNLVLPSEAHKVNAIADRLQLEPEFLALPAESAGEHPEPAAMVTLAINGGRKNKVRPGDVLGALTGERGIAGDQVGKIDIFDFVTYVAVRRGAAKQALARLQNGTIKGRKFRVRKL
ncbi:ATP-dependent RNA helicase [Marinobacterium nitratireducens]|uniref:ATP-dependent RNA helicase n=1 Tax=Marinobacterium nitratireducens TaxID=518897 RepID=A0A918DPA1_9GAMM|nr:ATP-dependent RNA helicase DbpA [Marinobacterium nitratireducens]GGO78219.1 ATP-dependent RNA helicase [Marinobacterium nitratireducens]